MDLVKSPLVPPHLAAKYEAEAGRYWDLFYRRNQTRFFKDRHYFDREFPQLLTAGTVLEVGCGVGNTVYPLLDLNPAAHVYACDFAPSAVALVRQHPLYATGRVTAFVADITGDDLTANVPAGSVDVCTMVFVLSAISPEAMPRALRQVARTLRPGGQLLFRDYAAGDLAEERLAGEGRQQLLGDNFYVRWDGTRAYYFTEEFVRQLFEAEGFACQYVSRADKLIENRKRGAVMDRRFVQAVFTYTGSSGSGSGSSINANSGSSSGGCGSADCGPGRSRGGTEVQAASNPATGKAAAAVGPAAQHQQSQQQQESEDAEVELEEAHVVLGSTHLDLYCHRAQPGSAAAAAAAAGRAAAEALAALVLHCPSAFHNTHVLDLCSWDAPLAALAALRWCRRAVAAGAGEAALGLLRRNAVRSGPLFIIERLRLQQLSWWQHTGSTMCENNAERQQQQQQHSYQQQLQQQHQLMKAFPEGFQMVLAAQPSGIDAVADAGGGSALPCLLRTAAALLSRQPGALLVLCISDHAAAKQELAATAAGSGLAEVPASSLPAELAAAMAATAEAAAAEAAAAAPGQQPLQFMCLRHLP